LGSILDEARAGQRLWRSSAPSERGELLRAIAAQLRADRETLAAFASREMGKPIVESRAEVEKCAVACEYYAGIAEEALQPVPVRTDARESWYRYEPLGVVLAIMPWNFPYWQVIRCVAPALALGNAVVLKHSPNVTGSALALEKSLHAAGVDPAVFRVIIVAEPDVPAVVREIVRHPAIAAVTVTGSSRAGAAVAGWAGEALKPAVLELGGSDPFVVLDDADLETAVAGALRSRFLNSGQSCLAAKRFIVADTLAGEFAERFAAGASELVMGDPLSETTQVGPIAREDLRAALGRQVRESVHRGALILAGGRDRPGVGSYYEPTVLMTTDRGIPAMTEETFGPVATVIAVRGDEEAIAMANATPYGLGASIWTADVDRARGLMGEIESGAVFVNQVVASDARLPFGGVKGSGFGRELGIAGLYQFANLRSYVIGPSTGPPLRSE
jgi:succinate-semialdehyde dehydrogenase/glutarate-semialdehyde dehydrogenase